MCEDFTYVNNNNNNNYLPDLFFEHLTRLLSRFEY